MLFRTGDLIMSHLKSLAVTQHVIMLEMEDRSAEPLLLNCRKEHECLGTNVHLSLGLGRAISQFDFIKKVRMELPKDLKGLRRKVSAPFFNSK